MANENIPTIFWHDYETFGVSPAKDRPAQFAGIRTDLDLNVIGEPENFYCQIAPDYLPSPEAIFVTGITPQTANSKGLVEAEFMQRINLLFSAPETCVAGYNSLRFDDEVTRYGFYRNFIDPYAREWQNNNSRWDIIDLARACYAFRPEGINWPVMVKSDDGTFHFTGDYSQESVNDEHFEPSDKTSFRLELLTKVNQISHESAHDAMSDVYATIALAKLIKDKQPKLFDYYFNLRRKQAVSAQIDVTNMKPLVHTSGMIARTFNHSADELNRHGSTTLIAPVIYHPENKNAVVCIRLDQDISPLLELSAEEIHQRLYTKRSELADDELPIPIKEIHINKCPFIGPASLMDDAVAKRICFDKPFAREQYKRLKNTPDIREKLNQVFAIQRAFENATDPDLMLYTGGFFSYADKAKIDIIRQTAPQNLAGLELQFEDSRLKEMFFRYRARNYPATLSHQEQLKWREFCQTRLSDPDYVIKLENLFEETQDNPDKQRLLKELVHYLQSL